MALFKSFNNLETSESGTSQWPDTKPEKVKCLIIGSGPAGYTAAIYAARANMSPVLYEGMEPGGQLTTTTEIDNFPGYPKGITGSEMMEDLKRQALRFDTDVRSGMATKTDLSKRPFKILIDDKDVIEAETIIIATGARAKYLGLETESTYRGSGVSACATCDGFFYRGKRVAVVGGGDTAAEEATYLASLADKVYLIIRKDYMRASEAMKKRVESTKNIEILYEHETKELYGDGVVEGAKLVKRRGKEDETEVDIKIDGFFLAIGHTPNSKIFADYITTDKEGYIITDAGSCKTNIPGVFAAGDVQDRSYRQAITAAGSGCKAALDAERFLGEQE